MTRKHAELERELIEDLLPRTGRSLADWMAAIDAAGLTEKNEIIDWLRPKGFTFANASWLERIHNNGGRPIYIDTVDARPLPARASVVSHRPPPMAQPAPAQLPPLAKAAAAPAAALPTVVRPAVVGTAGLADTLARGKAFRPLAEMLLRQVEGALPGVVLAGDGDLVRLGRPAEIGVLHVGPRELRLGLALGEDEMVDGLVRARIPGAGPNIGQMIVLTDARQIGAPLIELIRRADARVNAGD